MAVKPPCKECLKFPICKHKQEFECKDLVYWIVSSKNGERMIYLEKWWDKELASILCESGTIRFKKKKDQYSCLILKNM